MMNGDERWRMVNDDGGVGHGDDDDDDDDDDACAHACMASDA